MKVNELISEYNKAKRLKKEYDFSKHIKLKYMPYTAKSALVKSIVNASSYEEIAGKQIYKQQTSKMLFLFTMQLIMNYTDIEFEQKDVVSVYDSLNESGMINALLNVIPESETTILKSLLDMERDDLENNTRSLVSFLETKFESMDLAINSILDVLERPEIRAKIEEFKK